MPFRKGNTPLAEDVVWIYLVRHGETDSNRDHRLQGHADTPLNGQGRWQASRLAQPLSRLAADLVCSSDLARCRETAQLALNLPFRDLSGPAGGQCETCLELRERSYGAWEGLTAAEVEAGYPVLYHDWRTHRTDFCPPGGETYAQSSSRIVGFIETAATRVQSGRIVLFSHGGVIGSALRHALGLPPHAPLDLTLDNASITALRITGAAWSIAFLNDTCHLRE